MAKQRPTMERGQQELKSEQTDYTDIKDPTRRAADAARF